MNLSQILSIYRDERFFLFAIGTWLIGVIGFTFFASFLTWIAWKQPKWAEKYRIQSRQGLTKKFVIPSIKYSLFNSTLSLVMVVVSWPLLRFSAIHSGSLPKWYVILGQFIFFVYLDDFIYYWFHRAMHWKYLYHSIHSVHHRIIVPWAVCAHYMHPVEFLITVANVLLGPILLGSHVLTIWLWVLFRQWIAAEGHCGYDFPWNPSRLFPFYEGSSYHDFHHSKFQGNYSGFTGYLDRIFGTRSPNYEKYLLDKKPR
jgi:4-alpha-methyl-delta7-sterol-4alpha-methyl oxidase